MENREIYFVDDNADQRLLVRNVFKNYLPEYKIRLFDSGQALYLHLLFISSDGYKGPLPGLLLLDLNMPGIDGYNLVKLIRKRLNSKNISWNILPIVVLTSLATNDQLNDCYEAGANSIVIKPIDVDGLRRQLELISRYWIDYNNIVTKN
jgi:CheY-like chemotaxis protein